MKTNLDSSRWARQFREIIAIHDRDVLVVANAGAGKTRLLVEHYFALLEQGFDPHQILTFTFTEKAANELRQRIFSALPKHPAFRDLDADLLREWREKILASSIGTIHQFCLRIVEEARGPEDGQKFKIIDEATDTRHQEKLLRRYLWERFEDRDPAVGQLLKVFGMGRLQELIRDYLGRLGNFGGKVLNPPPPEPMERELLQALHNLAKPLWEKLKKDKEKLGWLSFDDLEKRALRLVQDPSLKLKKFLNKFSFVLVDEFQDTSPNQIGVIEGIRDLPRDTGQRPRLFSVGDPKQSIYRFRNVDRLLLEKTEQHILEQGGERFHFTQNFRSTPALLELVNAYSRGAFPKAHPSQAVREDISGLQAALISIPSRPKKSAAEETRRWEASWVAEEIHRLSQQKKPLEQIAVLYRASASALPLIQELKTRNIPFTIRGGRALLERQEILDLKHLLYFLNNPKDSISLIGILRSPLFLISDATLYHLSGWIDDKTDLFQILREEKFQTLSEKYPEEIEKLAWVSGTLREWWVWARDLTAFGFLKEICRRMELGSLYAHATGDDDCILAIEQFLDWLKQIEEENSPMGLGEMVAMLKQLERTPVNKAPLGDMLDSKGCLQLLTIHAAKGLQFDTVFLIDLIRQAPPRTSLLQNAGSEFALKINDAAGGFTKTPRFEAIEAYHRDEEQEENKRLLYVALTRAENQLYVTLHPGARSSASLQTLLEKCLGDSLEKFILRPPEAKPMEKITPPQEVNPPVLAKTSPQEPRRVSLETTVSEIETFSTCPLKHHFAYRYELSEDSWDQAPQLSATEMGTLFHIALNYLHRFPEKNPAEAVDHLLKSKSLWNLEQPLAQLQQSLESYLKGKLFEKIKSAQQDYSELPFLIHIDTAKLRGQIDRLIKTPKGWILIDFKWSSHAPSQSEILKKYGFQLKTYALAAEKFLRVPLDSVEVQILSTQKAYAFKFSKDQLEEQRKLIQSLLPGMNKTRLETITLREACYDCPFNKKNPICPVPQGGSWRPSLF